MKAHLTIVEREIMHVLECLGRFVDDLSVRVGKSVGLIVVALIGAVTYDVIMRYVFIAPTVWAYDISYMLNGLVAILGTAWVVYRRGSIAVDVFYRRFRPRTQLMINTIGHIGFFFPVVGCLVYTSWNRAILSWVQNEAVSVSIWQPPLYPFRTIVAVGFSLILLQGVVVFARDAHKLISGKVRLP